MLKSAAGVCVNSRPSTLRMEMGVRMSPFLDIFIVALAFALVVALVVFVARFLRLSFALAFLIRPALVVLSVTCVEESPLLVGLLML